MILVEETTEWTVPNHRYLLSDDKSKAFGYIKSGKTNLEMFIKPMDFSTRGRKFKTLEKRPDFEKPVGKAVQGSKGQTYYVTNGTCTCPGFKFRGDCKHVRDSE